jgi:acetyl/propionyl-CoA carboxylase alpha subunit
MFKSVLVANRGEIAVRICKTLRRMGIRSVVVASIPDRRSLAVRSADAWVLLEGYSAAESYLDIDAVIAAAKSEGCEAVHPGYGFLSERADFAERCAAEGIVFVGPPPEVLRGMGDKAAARQLAVSNGVPVVPGWDGDDDEETLAREAARIGYPVMLKARGGGGGRGMREVFSADGLPEAIESARREALAAFGDGGLLLEKLVTNAHHVEVQVLADAQGSVIHLGERDCSVQRRHQKLIEETPSPVVDEALRERLTGYALTLARAIGYVNAGTFEFLVSIHDSRFTTHDSEAAPTPEGDVYFLEVNPRLQVEHPVTEMVTGLDLVELQLRVAAGEPLPMRQEDVKFEGHAIEFRINAEDPWDGFKPSSGRVKVVTNRGIRFDTGYAEEDEVPSHYDSLIAKVVLHCQTRDEVLDQAEFVLEGDTFHGPRSNLRLLAVIAASGEFRAGLAGIGWLENSLVDILEGGRTPDEFWIAAAVSQSGEWLRSGSPWGERSRTSAFFDDGTQIREVEVLLRRSGARPEGEAWLDGGGTATRFTFNQEWSRFDVALGDQVIIAYYESLGRQHVEAVRAERLFYLVPPPPLPRRAHAAAEGSTVITAPLPGSIAAVRVAESDSVEAGQLLLVLEAMKMEHRISAPAAGVVKAVNVRERDQVREGDVLIELG